MPRPNRHRSKFLLRLTPLKVVLVLVVLAVALAILELTNVTHLFHKSSIPPVIPTKTASKPSSSSPPSPTKNSQQKSSTSKDSTSNTDSSDSSTNVNLPLYSPYGSFVSNHQPGYQGSPTQERSVCNTTPGASCYISFTKGSTSTRLPVQTTDSKGATYWDWDIKTAGLTSGGWTITAVASLDGQSKTTQDPLPLSVQ